MLVPFYQSEDSQETAKSFNRSAVWSDEKFDKIPFDTAI